MNNFTNDFDTLVNRHDKEFEKLKDKTILISGALGMLAACTVDFLLFLNEKGYNINIILLGRSKERLIERFGMENDHLMFLVQDIKDEITLTSNIDYILHAAGNSSPFYIKNEPVNIIEANVLGSLNIVNLAKKNNIINCLFTSTREVYGNVQDKDEIYETTMGCFDPLDARSCYPESKRMAENIFKSANIQYGIPFNVVRIAHSYGPGMKLNDGRVMSDFIGDTLQSINIRLNSDGLAIRSFCYVTDAINAMLLVLLKGEVSTVYNIANEKEDITIFDLAKEIINKSGKGIELTRIEPVDGLYCNYPRTRLNTDRIEQLGWIPLVNLSNGIERTLNSFSDKL
ncbi:NAD-dependent epimerase/dehydratase family protein [Vibrio rarus]|uniref:NAD-dependent epimerase/dehydratase family protein n=1 Tax=Vibrio rarus TaxID=413403 RepID=UPI0021C4780C|nr:NAD-dependent epimerase/dehydratase family protein [Vibrio rarus]